MNTNTNGSSDAPVLKKDWRYYSGMTALVLSGVLPLLGFAVPLLGLSTATSAAIIGALVAGGPEVMLLLAAALLGKETLHAFLGKGKRAIVGAWDWLLFRKPATSVVSGT